MSLRLDDRAARWWGPDPEQLDPAPRRLLVFAAAAGVLLDVGLRGGTANAVVAAGVFVVVGALLADGRLPSLAARLLAGGALVPAAFLAVRASPWLAASNTLAVAALLTLAVTFARSGSVIDTSPRRVLRRAGHALARGLAGPALLRHLIPPVTSSTARRFGRVARAGLLALPFLAVVVLLMAAGDAVFARLLLPEVDVTPVLGHALLIPFLTVVVLCCLVAASSAPDDEEGEGRFGAAEVATMLALAAGVLGLFVVSQLVALTDAGRRLVQEAGLTPAEYARSGFFQLAWATAILVAFLAVVRAAAAPGVFDKPVVRTLGAAVPLLAGGLVVVSLRRMALYDRTFGLTMLRLWVVGAAIWMGALLVMIALRNAGAGGERNWVVAGATAVGLTLVLAADVLSPEAFVARHNVARADEGADLDFAYLRELSDDAVPTLARLRTDHPALAAALRCTDRLDGVAALNLAAAQAEDARRAACDADAGAVLSGR